MKNTKQIQQELLSAIYQDKDVDGVVEGGISSLSRLSIYKNNVRKNLINALLAVYPTINKFVGEEFFAHLANSYITENPAKSCNIDEYGEGFAKFIENFESLNEFPFLADLAKVEWAIYEVLFSKDVKSFNAALLAKLSVDEIEKLQFQTLPYIYYIKSEYNLPDLWGFANKSDGNLPEINKKSAVLIKRNENNYEITINEIELWQAEVLSLLNKGQDLVKIAKKLEIDLGQMLDWIIKEQGVLQIN